MKKLFLIGIIVAINLFVTRINSQQNFAVPITFSVTEAGVNRFIATQWSDITTSWSGSYQGLNYSLELSRPTISLSENSIKIILQLSCVSSVYNGDFPIEPTLTIPSTTISANDIIAEYQNLRQQIDAIIQFTDSRLKDVVEDVLEPIDWIIYKGKILTINTQRITDVADIKWVGLPTLSFGVSSNEINITVTPTIQATPPSYTFQSRKTGCSSFGIRVLSNNKTLIDAVKSNKVWNVLGQEINLTLVTSLPTSITWDVSLQKYVAEIYFQASYCLASQNVFTKLKLKRNNMETLWAIELSFPSGSQSSWAGTNFSAIRGE